MPSPGNNATPPESPNATEAKVPSAANTEEQDRLRLARQDRHWLERLLSADELRAYRQLPDMESSRIRLVASILSWVDASASVCGETAADIIRALIAKTLDRSLR